ncbi:uncharacterized protein LOC116945426 isoform X2 [Petromyzon marinus]|uniref:uncharacterized protein LOC116945426 isoform X2 n=1 Tax=Petromyzon marinus TaxID=7757 RepID=UPI003F6F3341
MREEIAAGGHHPASSGERSDPPKTAKPNSMASRGWKHLADAFCHVYGQFIKKRARKYSVEASAKTSEAYKAYFGMPVRDQDKPWAPHFTCKLCKTTLEGSLGAPQRITTASRPCWTLLSTPRRTTTGRTGHSGQSSLWGGTRSSGSHLWTLGSSSHLVQAMNKIWKEKQRTTQMRLAPSYSAGNMGYSKWTVHQRRNALSCWSNGENWCKVPLAPK